MRYQDTTWQAKLKKATWAVFTGLFDADDWEGLYNAGFLCACEAGES